MGIRRNLGAQLLQIGVLVALTADVAVLAFVAQSATTKTNAATTVLHAHKADYYGKAFVGVFTGMTLASQVAFASLPPLQLYPGAFVTPVLNVLLCRMKPMQGGQSSHSFHE